MTCGRWLLPIRKIRPRYLADKWVLKLSKFRAVLIQYTFEEPFLSRSIISYREVKFQAQRSPSMQAMRDNFRQIKQLFPRVRAGKTVREFHLFHPRNRSTLFQVLLDPAGTEPGAEDLDAAKWRPNLKMDHIFLSVNQIDQFEGKNGSVWR